MDIRTLDHKIDHITMQNHKTEMIANSYYGSQQEAYKITEKSHSPETSLINCQRVSNVLYLKEENKPSKKTKTIDSKTNYPTTQTFQRRCSTISFHRIDIMK